jgi:phosphoribosylaminoimidazolecarboxamide formyltransferase/IMP cyclohydrolase
MDKRKWALISAFDKNDALRAFARGLADLSWGILASSGTKKFLDGHGIPSKDVSDIVGAPILGHRVVTLSREVYAAILARQDNAGDMAELRRIGVSPISLVCVDLYPLLQELQSTAATEASVVEKVDIGGPTLLRAAAKSGALVVSDPEQYGTVLRFLSRTTTEADLQHLRYHLAAKAEAKVAHYAATAASFYQAVEDGDFRKAFRIPT